MASSLSNKSGRYTFGGTPDKFPNRLGWWERKVMPFQNDDIIVTVSGPLVKRPDLISNLVYGTQNYAWLVLQYNTILDIDVDLAEGKQIRLPAYNRVS